VTAPTIPPELLEKFRTIGLRIDRAGRIWHQAEEVTHPRLRQALLRWLDVRDDGRDIVRLDDARYAYVDVEDAHLRAVSARWQADRAILTFDDATEAELDYATVTLGDGDALYCRARDGRLRARLTTAAHHAIAARIVEEPSAPRGFALEARGRRWPIG
jgi:uncharacterized protein